MKTARVLLFVAASAALAASASAQPRPSSTARPSTTGTQPATRPSAEAPTRPSGTQPRPATGDTRAPAPVTTGTAGRVSAAALPNDYRLSIGDKLRVEVYREPQLSQSVEVRPDGKITLPLVGDVTASGTTPRELADTLTERLREYVTTPVVTVIVAEATPPAVYVMGEVNAPGMQPLRTPTTVLQALAMAGGFKEFANTKKIKILRRGEDGAVETLTFNYKDAVEARRDPLYLKAGDTVIVP
jgi:polysaccharide export outer membrane protein